MKPKIIRYKISFKTNTEEGVFYISYPSKAKALKQKRVLKKDFPKAKWSMRKTLYNSWIKNKNYLNFKNLKGGIENGNKSD